MHKNCIVCKKQIDLSNDNERTAKIDPENHEWHYGAVFRDTVGFGSIYDMTELVICICDDCITENKQFLIPPPITNDAKQMVEDVLNHLEDKDIRIDDIGDMGNELGIALAEYIMKDKKANLKNFIHGIEHGLSLADGTH